MSLSARLRRLFSSESVEIAPGTGIAPGPLSEAANALNELRGENTSQASDGGREPDVARNIANAGRDAGFYNMGRGTEIVGKSANNYRHSK